MDEHDNKYNQKIIQELQNRAEIDTLTKIANEVKHEVKDCSKALSDTSSDINIQKDKGIELERIIDTVKTTYAEAVRKSRSDARNVAADISKEPDLTDLMEPTRGLLVWAIDPFAIEMYEIRMETR